MAIVQRGGAILASGGASGDNFGGAIALGSSGTVMAVGAWTRNSNDGAVYIYDYSGGSWTQRGSALGPSASGLAGYFGASVALSADGLVLAVGEPEYWHDPDEYYGIVHVYDWSGSAWVERTPFLVNAPDAYNFGSVIALSGNGLVLAVNDYVTSGEMVLFDWSGSAWVERSTRIANSYGYGFDSFALSYDGSIAAGGISSYDSPFTNAGAVVLFDYSGGSWTQRAALAQGSTSTPDMFGLAVALSSDGAILVVGATQWDGAATNQGAAYVFDWSGTAWGERAIIGASDASASDYFGSAVAISATGAVIAAGATNYDGGTFNFSGAAYIFDATSGDTVFAATSLTLTASTGTAAAPTELTVTQYIGAATALTVSAPTGTAAAPTSLAVTATGSATAPTALALLDNSQHWPLWSLRVMLDGVDISARLTGQASVDAEEGAAQVANFSILPAAGVVAPLDYVGKPVTIDYLQTIGGGSVARRVFTGRIDTPHFDPDAVRLDFTCVDDLQNRVAALDRATLDGLIGGRYSTAVQGDILDNWAYAQAQLTTVAASLDAGAHGGIRVTPWQIGATWATFADGDLLYQRSSVTEPQRSTLVNEVTATFEYRYPRLRQRYTATGWSGTLLDMAPCGYQYPTQQEILGAAGGSGWSVISGVFYPAPAAIPHASGGFIRPPAGSIDMAILHMAQRHAQTVTETFTLTVTAPESITANGTLPQTLRGALASSFDGNAWESALDVAPLMPTGGEMDYAPDAPRSAADYAIETLLAQAQVQILASHRSARVGNATLCNPDLDLDKKVAIATVGISAEGKVARRRHVFDLDAGSAITEFEIACFGVGGAGIITPDSLGAPAAPAPAVATQDWSAAIPPLWVNTYGITSYSDSLMGLLLNPPESISVEDVPGVGAKSFPNPYYVAGSYPATGFRVQMPGVDDADRNPLDKTVDSAYQIIIPSDPLTFTVP